MQARNHKLDVVQQRDRSTGEVFYILNNNQRFCEGYLQKVVAIKGLLPEETLPPLDELQRYNAVRAWQGPTSPNLQRHCAQPSQPCRCLCRIPHLFALLPLEPPA